MLNENLKYARNAKGLTQEDVAQFLNVKRQTYSAYERGISYPDPTILKKLAELFEVDVNFLLEDSAKNLNSINKKTDININLKKIREEHKMSQTYVAEYLGITRQGYNHYETGKRVPPLDMMERLCVLFDIDMNSLTSNTDENEPIDYNKIGFALQDGKRFNYNELSEEGKKEFEILYSFLLEREKERKKNEE